ncbi:selenoprotein K-like [Bolinopsis microptera]|uniref:selenoprotein K-like n=1 Tax=Bolinopsis microptera TaxID=2820187 RepID=UPI00307A2B7E
MPYVSGGRVHDSRPIDGLGSVKDLFWGVLNFCYLFFLSLVSPSSSPSRIGGNGQSAPKAPKRRMGGFGGGRGSGPTPPPMGGGG